MSFDSDFDMYYRECVVLHKEKGYVKVLYTEDGDKVYLQTLGDEKVFYEEDMDKLELRIEPVGFVQLGKTVVYIALRQSRSYKKSFHINNIVKFYPQSAEYDAMLKRLPNVTLEAMFQNNLITPLDEVDEELENRYAVVIHRNFAIVKKGAYKEPVVYHRKEIVAKYVDGDFVPLDGQNDLYVRKLRVELGLCSTV